MNAAVQIPDTWTPPTAETPIPQLLQQWFDDCDNAALRALWPAAQIERALRERRRNTEVDASIRRLEHEQRRNADRARKAGAATRIYTVRESVLDPDAAVLGDIFTSPPEPPEFVIEGIWPVNVGVEAAAGGLGKTTRHQFEHIHLINGMGLYGRRNNSPGAVVVFTKEDQRTDFSFRYYHQARALDLTAQQRRALAENVFIEDLSGAEDRLVMADAGGNLALTGLAENIIETYRGRGVRLVEFDPMNLFGPGERFVNDGEAKLMEAGRLISRELRAVVRYTAHVSKESARGRYVDAHAGRGGSAGADNARFVHVFVPHDTADEKNYPPPAGISPDVLAQGRLFRLHLPKVSGAPPIREPIWLEREGFIFRHIAAAPATQDQREAADVKALKDFLAFELGKGIRHTRHTLEDSLGVLNLSRSRLRRALVLAQEKGHVASVSFPESERHGARTHYLAPATPASYGEVSAK